MLRESPGAGDNGGTREAPSTEESFGLPVLGRFATRWFLLVLSSARRWSCGNRGWIEQPQRRGELTGGVAEESGISDRQRLSHGASGRRGQLRWRMSKGRKEPCVVRRKYLTPRQGAGCIEAPAKHRLQTLKIISKGMKANELLDHLK